jgi:hypothetical protein
VLAVLFRVRNTMTTAIYWVPRFHYTANGWSSERASIALNGSELWSGEGGAGTVASYANLEIQPNRTSTVIFVAQGSQPFVASGHNWRALALAFVNNALALPAGLEFVDDLDTATGGWEQ